MGEVIDDIVPGTRNTYLISFKVAEENYDNNHDTAINLLCI